MRWRMRVSLAVIGIMLGMLALLSADMLIFGGRFVVHSIHARVPTCSAGCHSALHPRPGIHPVTSLRIC